MFQVQASHHPKGHEAKFTTTSLAEARLELRRFHELGFLRCSITMVSGTWSPAGVST